MSPLRFELKEGPDDQRNRTPRRATDSRWLDRRQTATILRTALESLAQQRQVADPVGLENTFPHGQAEPPRSFLRGSVRRPTQVIRRATTPKP